MDTGVSFGMWLRRHRRALDLTQGELGRRIGYAEVTIRKVESDELRPSRQLARKLAEQFGVDPAELEAFLRFARDDGRGGPQSYPVKILDPLPRPTLLRRHDNLPAQTTRFIGRENDVKVALELLRGDGRLLTLTGPPGIGKTRLALEVASQLVDSFENGLCYVPLALINGPRLVAAISNALGIHDAGRRQTIEGLHDALRDQQMVLVLDDFEQVVEAAPLVADLLAAAPRLKVLVTSREVLRIRGEHLQVVPPLSLPHFETSPALKEDVVAATTRSEAVRLFVARAQDVKPNFAITSANAPTVAEICRCLDGLPLAIELAAARIRSLLPQAMLSHLTSRLELLTGGPRDLPARQQTLRGAIAWSHDLLDEDEVVVFRRLSVFVGGCALEAVEAVCLSANTFELLESLVRKSLLKEDGRESAEPRLSMLETIREYARERLVEAGEYESTVERHRDWFVGLAERAAPEFVGREQVTWLDRIDLDHDNLQAVLRAAIDKPDVERGLRVANALYLFWMQRYISEGRTWLSALLAIPGSAPSAIRSRALSTAGAHAGVQGDLPSARRMLAEGLATAREAADGAAVAFALLGLAAIDRAEGDYSTTRERLEESLVLWRKVGDRWHLGRCLFLLGELAAGQADHRAGPTEFEESLALFRELGDRWGVAYSLRALGFAAYRRREYDEARRLYEESQALGQEIGDRALVAWTLWGIGLIAHALRDRREERAMFTRSLIIFRERQERGAVAHVLGGFAALAAAQGSPERAVRLAGAASTLRATIGARLLPTDQADFDLWVEPARRVLSDATQKKEWARGGGMTLEHAVAYALSEEDEEE